MSAKGGAALQVECVVSIGGCRRDPVFFRPGQARAISDDLRGLGYIEVADQLNEAAARAAEIQIPAHSAKLPRSDFAARGRETLLHLLKFGISCSGKTNSIAELLATVEESGAAAHVARESLLRFGLRRLCINRGRNPHLAVEYKNSRLPSIFATLGKGWSDVDGAMAWREILESIPGVKPMHRTNSARNGKQYALLIPWALVKSAGR